MTKTRTKRKQETTSDFQGVELLTRTPTRGKTRAWLLLAHGAGAPKTSPFLEQFTALLLDRGIAVSRFDFAYMAARLRDGKRRPPPRAERLQSEYTAALQSASELASAAKLPVLIGGKSLGGRVASMVADQAFAEKRVRGLVCLGYPFHPPARPDALRTAHLERLECPALIIQGERDPFGSRQEVENYALSKTIAFHWASDGDHDLGPRGSSGFTRKGNLAAAADAISAFLADPIG